jgi:hypothetical protein
MSLVRTRVTWKEHAQFHLKKHHSLLKQHTYHTTQVLKLLQGDDETIAWARSQVTASFDGSDEEASTPDANMQSHLNLALLGVEEDALSRCSSTVDTSADGYWSRSSSFD